MRQICVFVQVELRKCCTIHVIRAICGAGDALREICVYLRLCIDLHCMQYRRTKDVLLFRCERTLTQTHNLRFESLKILSHF